MERRVLGVLPGEEGQRLDHFLSSKGGDTSRSYWQKICRRGYIFVNGEKQTKSGVKLKKGDKIEILIPPAETLEVEAEDIHLEILHEDEDLIVINKPKGMVVHPSAGHYSGTLVNALLSHCKELTAIGDTIRPGIVHRLDKDTSGLMVAAKNERSLRSLAQQLKDRDVKREYIAVVHGAPPYPKGVINAPLGRDPRHRKRFAVVKEGKGRQAITYYEVIKKLHSFSLVSLKLQTGRTHQIRVHLAYIGSPVLGDPLYGPRRSPYRNEGQFLHARKLGFIHPRNKKYLEFTREPGEEFKKICKG